MCYHYTKLQCKVLLVKTVRSFREVKTVRSFREHCDYSAQFCILQSFLPTILTPARALG